MRIITKSRVFSVIGLAVLVALIWFVGPHFGLSVETRLQWILGAVLLWVVAALIGWIIAAWRGHKIEDRLRRDADKEVMDASAARRGEVAMLREQLLTALSTLKSSRLGKGALYELPWYMLIGHTAAGKSTALLHSGLTFPFAEQGVPGGVEGLGGTRNCDWFLSTEAILLDTAGRYTTQSEDREAWMAFLKLLRRYRSRAPVNGVLIATSLPELLQYNKDSFATYVRQIRERINEIEEVFGLRVPVYLIFTKLDLLGGFGQFFGDMTETERDQVWGVTLPHDPDADFDLCQEAQRQCELLYQGLNQAGKEKLALARGVGNKPALFAFPFEFHTLKEAVGHLMELLYEEDPYHSKPLLRGFYFTSALQSDSAESHVAAAARVSGQFGLSRSGFKPVPQTASNGYFLSGLFREVIFPDQYLIQRQSRPRTNRLRLATLMAGAGALVISVAALSKSWIDNRDMLGITGTDYRRASELIDEEGIAGKLKGLLALQKHLGTLQRRHATGIPLKMGLGLYQGRKLEDALWQQYCKSIRLVMLDPMQGRLEDRLLELIKHPPKPAPVTPVTAVPTGSRSPNQANTPPLVPQIVMPLSVLPPPIPVQTPQTPQTPPVHPELDEESRKQADEGYDALKTYLMLADRTHLDTDYLTSSLMRFWRPRLKEQRGDADMEAIEADAVKVVNFYVAQYESRTPDLPLVDNNILEVDESRLVLRTAATPRPIGAERVYLGLKEQANAKFPAINIARILGGKDADILTGQATVPGVFTREAYEKFMRDAIVEASHNQTRNDDWVLDSTDDRDPDKEGTSARMRQEIEKLYRADYAEAWMKLLRGTGFIAQPGTIAEAERMLERLADPKSSPIKVVLQRISYETSWDNPAPQLLEGVATAQNAAQSAVQSAVSGRTGGRVRLPNAAAAVSLYGELGQQFAAIHAISDSDKDAAPILAGYLERLARVREQLYPAATGNDPDTVARKLVIATLDASGSEFVNTSQYVVGTLLPALQEQTFRDILRPILLSPLTQSYATLLPPIEQALNDAWREEVLDAWQELAGKFPFANAQNEARISEIAHFAGPNGTLVKFVNERLGGLVIRRGVQLTPRVWADMGVQFDAHFAANVARLLTLGSEIAKSGNDVSSFKLRPVPNPALTGYVIEIDGQKRIYRNGPQEWWSFVWPKGEILGASVQVTGISEDSATLFSHPGRMGLIRLFDRSVRTLDVGKNAGQLKWRFQSQSGPQIIKVDFQMSGGINPMQLSGLTNTGLAKRVTQREPGNNSADQLLAFP